jgi:cephalosporin hydroxylase
MDLLIPNRSGEFPDITKPLELAKQLQDRVILIEDFDSKADVANEVLDGLNKHWRHKGKHIVIGDSLIGPTQDPADSAPFEHYRLVEGER